VARGGVNVEEQRPILLDLPPGRARAALAKLGLVGVSTTTIDKTVALIDKLSDEFATGHLMSYETVELNPVVLTDSGPKIADVLMIRQRAESRERSLSC
jgi:hypothetical protein